MGKRELVLIALFVAVGVAVYQFTAPPPPPGTDVSVGGIFQRLKRNVQGSRETASATSQQVVAVDKAISKLRINLPRASDLIVTVSDRDEIAAEASVTARGYNQEEAKAAADTTKIKIEPTGVAVVVSSAWNSTRRGGGDAFIQQVAIKLTVPRRMAIRIEPHLGLLNVTGAESLEVISNRGETRLLQTSGAVQVNHVSGQLEIDGGSSLKLTSRNSRASIAHIAGRTSIDATGSKLRFAAVTGPLEIESRNTDLSLEDLVGLKPPLRINGQGGELRIAALRTEARIDGRNMDMDIVLGAPAPVTIYNLGAIRVTAPPGGYTLDAVATEGRIVSEDSDITATPGDGPDARVSAKIHGGGPTLTLRSTRGRIEVRKAAGK